jgi:hypothetical protein
MTQVSLFRSFLFLVATFMGVGSVQAQGFSALVSPPRFEDSAKLGSTYRNIIEISNVAGESSHFNLKTTDWTLMPDASVIYSDALTPNSCRTWVALESREVTIGPNGKKRFRFEVKVPTDTTIGECRFAIMIEGDAEAPKNSKVPVAVAGRIAIIVYLSLGDAKPVLSVVGAETATVEGRVVPAVRISNTGNAHGRLEGFVDGRDASGKKLTFMPSNLPIMPGETRLITLSPDGDRPGELGPVLKFPVQIKGALEWANHKTPIEASFDPD